MALPGTDFEITTSTGELLRLRGTLKSWSDENTQRINEHLIVNRDGAIHQNRGSGARKFTFAVLLREPGATEAYTLLESRLSASPFVSLTHPRFSTVKCVFLSLGAVENLDETINALTCDLTLAETGLRDIKQVSPTQAARQAVAATDLLVTLFAALGKAAGYPASVLTKVRGLVSYVSQFMALVDQAVITTTSAATGLVQDVRNVVTQPQLFQALHQVENQVKGLVAVLGSDVGAYPLTAQARLAHGYCLQAVIANGDRVPPVITYRVPARTSLIRMCRGLYGGGAQQAEELIGLLNRIASPHAIPTGALLQIPDPRFYVVPDGPAPSTVPSYA